MFAVILLPNFRLQAALRFRQELHAQPVGLVDGNDPKSGILEINDDAKREEWLPHMDLSEILF